MRKYATASAAMLDYYSPVIGHQLKFLGAAMYKELRLPPPSGTPLDTRWHAASWRFTVDKIDKEPASRSLRKKNVPLSVPLSPAQDNDVAAKWTSTIYVSNHSDVIEGLNAGVISQQSPRNFVIRVRNAVAKAASSHLRLTQGA